MADPRILLPSRDDVAANFRNSWSARFRQANPSRTVDVGAGAFPWAARQVVAETVLAFYEAHNPTDRVIGGTASFNVFPDAAGGYFTKIECFCFTEQVLQPGETVQMPVTFYVDPAMVEDPEGKFVHEIVLSYTFHETPLPEEQAALETPAEDAAAVN